MKTTLLASSLLFLTATYAVAAPLAADQGQQKDVENRSEKAVENKGTYYSNKRSENAVEATDDYYSVFGEKKGHTKRSEMGVKNTASKYYENEKRSENDVDNRNTKGHYYGYYKSKRAENSENEHEMA